MYFSPEQSIGIVDIRSLGYYNIKPEVLRFNLTGFHGLSSRWDMDPRCEECFTKFSTQNVRYKKRGTKERGPDPYPWLDKDDPRRHMTDEEILYKHVDLSESHLTESEKEEVMDLVIDNKKAFSLRDEIGKCPDIKVNIEGKRPLYLFRQTLPYSRGRQTSYG